MTALRTKNRARTEGRKAKRPPRGGGTGAHWAVAQ
jgi:hypothetical protein